MGVILLLALLAAPRTILFVDDHEILYRSGTRRVIQPAQRHAANPVIAEEKPWELAIGWTSVHRDPRTGKYQIWYQGYSKPVAREKSRESVVCYAESDDGIQWRKPALRLFDFNGDRDTNIVMVGNAGYGSRYTNSVVVDPRDPDPRRRYKMVFYDWFKQGAREYPGLQLAFSPDGIHWTKQLGGPAIYTLYGGAGQQPPFAGEDPVGREGTKPAWRYPLAMSDGADLMWDARRQLWALYGKMWFDRPDGGLVFKHGMGRIESRDLRTWSAPELLLTPGDEDSPDTEFHTTPVFFYKDRYFCLNQILRREGEAANLMIDIELMVSRDGRQWDRPYRRDFFLPRGQPGAFDGGSMFTNANPILQGEEMRFYYGAYPGTAVGGTRGPSGDPYGETGIGMASIRLDRFAAIIPVDRSDQRSLGGVLEHRGQVTLRPLDLTQVKRITLNADARDGWIKAELLTEQGYRVRGYAMDESAEIHGDSFVHAVTWRGAAGLPKGRYLLRIHLDRAKLFALTLE
ncbi:MAG: hypothetical protein U0Q16_00310 [Bryobacteraceae bacterium]